MVLVARAKRSVTSHIRRAMSNMREPPLRNRRRLGEEAGLTNEMATLVISIVKFIAYESEKKAHRLKGNLWSTTGVYCRILKY